MALIEPALMSALYRYITEKITLEDAVREADKIFESKLHFSPHSFDQASRIIEFVCADSGQYKIFGADC